MKKKTTKYKDIRTLEDINRVKHQLEKKISLTEKSISEQTNLGRILVSAIQNAGESAGDRKKMNLELMGYLLPAGLDYLFSLLPKNLSKKQIRRLLIYSAIGGILALSVAQIIGRQNGGKDQE